MKIQSIQSSKFIDTIHKHVI